MNLKQLLAKLGKGETLTEAEMKFVAEQSLKATEAAEKAELGAEKAEKESEARAAAEKAAAEKAEKDNNNADESSSNNGSMIPRSRLNEEAAKRKEMDDQLKKLQKELQDYKDRDLTEQQRKDKKTAERISELESQLTENLTITEQLTKSAESANFDLSVHQLALSNSTKHRFKSADFLGLKIQKAGIDLKDQVAVDALMGGLLEEMPEMFITSVKPGAGANPSNGGKSGGSFESKKISEMTQTEKAAYHKEIGAASYDTQVKKEYGA